MQLDYNENSVVVMPKLWQSTALLFWFFCRRGNVWIHRDVIFEVEKDPEVLVLVRVRVVRHHRQHGRRERILQPKCTPSIR